MLHMKCSSPGLRWPLGHTVFGSHKTASRTHLKLEVLRRPCTPNASLLPRPPRPHDTSGISSLLIRKEKTKIFFSLKKRESIRTSRLHGNSHVHASIFLTDIKNIYMTFQSITTVIFHLKNHILIKFS